MCGLLGAISVDGLGKREIGEFLYQGMVTGWLRGEESTGLFTVNKKDNSVFYHKSILRGTEYMDTVPARRVLDNRYESHIFVGHHRWCTKGTVSYENAHPFQFGHITMVHNGSLSNDFYFPHADSTIPTVDSARLALNLSKVDNTVEFLSKIRGSYALIWWDAKLNALRIVRNEERPLSFAWGKKHNQFYFSSEGGHLSWLLERNNIETEGIGEANLPIASLEVHNLHTFTLVNGKIEITHEKYEENSEPFRAKASAASTHRGWTEYDYRYDGVANHSAATTGPMNVPQLPGPSKRVEESELPQYSEPEAPHIPKARLRKLNDQLAALGTEFGRTHTALPQLFEHSKHGTPGVHGLGYFSSVGTTDLDFIVPSISSKQYEALEQYGKYCHLRVIGITKSKKHKKEKPFLICQVAWHQTAVHWKNVISQNGNNKIDQNALVGPSSDDMYDDFILGPQNILILPSHFEALVRGGCASCGDPIDRSMAREVNWVKDDRPICPACWLSEDFWATEFNITPQNLL